MNEAERRQCPAPLVREVARRHAREAEERHGRLRHTDPGRVIVSAKVQFLDLVERAFAQLDDRAMVDFPDALAAVLEGVLDGVLKAGKTQQGLGTNLFRASLALRLRGILDSHDAIARDVNIANHPLPGKRTRNP